LTETQIESLADDVVAAFGLSAPIELDQIAREEGVQLVEGDYGDDFHGRIEYLAEVEAFVIYHPRRLTNHYPSRVRFSISHEFGHFYIPHHREILLKGRAHYSLEGFRHKNNVERQADTFAAALLIPTRLLKERMGRRGFLSLSQIITLADDCKASAQATAFRYTRFTKEPHLALVSENGNVLYGFASEEARAWGFWRLKDFAVPEGSASSRATASMGIVEGKTEVEIWFPERRTHAELWEEAVQLGSSARVLTLLSWSNYGK
jgi:hypothetical protein